MKLKLIGKRTLVVIFLLSLASCSVKQNSQSWTEGMRGMADSLSKLFPYIYDESRFSNPNNQPIISTHLNHLNFYSNTLDRHIAVGLSGNDPLFQLGLKGLKRNFQTAQEAYSVESYEYSQEVLKNAVNYCVKCHMRTNVGRSFMLYDKFSDEINKQGNRLEKAKFQVATRRFKQAITSLNENIRDSKIKSHKKFESLKMSLAIHIKNRASISDAKKQLSQFLNFKSLRKYKKIMKAWSATFKEFPKLSLISLEKAMQMSRSGESAFVEGTLKSLVLHQSLSSLNSKPKRAKIYFSLGKIYSRNSSLSFWELPSQYFEACIYELPYTKLAKKCYYNLEMQVRKSYNIDIDAPLPLKETAHLSKLKVLTEAKDNSSGSADSDNEI